MPQTIILVPDIYYRNWDERPGGTSGEMWLCLRPMIATGNTSEAHPLGDRLEDFFAWAQSPHEIWIDVGGRREKRYDFKSPHELGLGARVCGPGEFFMPINLPSELDVQIRIGRRGPQGQELAETRIDLPRTTALRATTGASEGEDALAPWNPATALPFARMFNANLQESLEKALAKAADEDSKARRKMEAAFAFFQQMEAGRRIRFTPDQIRDAYDKPETCRPVLEKDGTGVVTSIYWFMGLMARLGTQADLASLRNIDRVDIALRDAGTDYDMIPFPDTQGGMESAYEYFRKVGDGFAHTLTTELIDHEKRIYVAPGFRGLQRVEPPLDPASTLWVMESVGPQLAGGAQANFGGLARLGAIELRGVLTEAPDPDDTNPPPLPDIGDTLTVRPGLFVTGTLKRYRRFPDVPGAAGAKLLPTVMVFEPDPATAQELAKLRDPKDPDSLKRVFEGRAGQWKLKLLHDGVLPWDGPEPIFRVLAVPPEGATAAVAGSLVCQENSGSVFLAALDAPLPMEKLADGRHLWDPRKWGNPASPIALEQRWIAAAGTIWKDVRFNALRITGITKPDEAAANVMMIDEFDLTAAESPLRLEKVLGVTALSPRTAEFCNANFAANDPRNFDPLRDYEDDFINYNTVRVWRPDPSAPAGEVPLDPALLRAPQQTEAEPRQVRVGGAQRRQTIPLLHAWPTDPLSSQKIAPLNDEDAKKVKVSWPEVRDEVARRHGLSPEPDKGPYRIDLEHSYGDRLAVKDGNTILRFDRSARRSWPVTLPTFVEAKQQGEKARPFLLCRFVPGRSVDTVELEFDTDFLTFPEMTVFEARGDQRYAQAVSAWRALAELATPGAQISLEIRPATFDVLRAFRGKDGTADPAEVAARWGLVGGWASGIAQLPMLKIDGGAELEAIRTWASALIGGAQPATKSFEVPLPVGEKPGEKAHLLRVDLRIARAAATAPVPAGQQQLLPIPQQPGLFQVGENTMLGAWARLGFGPKSPMLDEKVAGPVWPQLADSRMRWTDERTAVADSVSPAPPPPLPAPPQPPKVDPERKRREAQAAVMAALDGSDWFAPAGRGPRTSKLAVQPIHVPVGFAPCRPHAQLQQQTQTALERLMTALRDTIDLAYPAWAQSWTAALWETRFAAIAALGREAEKDKGPGLLVAAADLLIGRLLYPQPDAADKGNAAAVREIAAAIAPKEGSPTGDLKWFATAVRRRLLADPGLFTDAKALLLTALDFIEDDTLEPQPPVTALARARFNRRGIDPDRPQEPSWTTLTLDNLIFAGRSASAPDERRLAMLEALDDARYGSSFEIPVTTTPKQPLDHIIDSYEELVDLDASQGGWPARPAVLPLAAANEGRLPRRTVHLASRALVAAPVLAWRGESGQLDDALARGETSWSVERLEQGEPGMPGVSGQRLRVAAARTSAAAPRSIERGVSFVLYRVAGDEEGSMGLEQSFENDGFFFRLRESDYRPSSQPAAVLDKTRLASEPLLRQLLFAGVGSDAAAEAASRFALQGTDYSADLADIIQTGQPALPKADFALIRLVRRRDQPGAPWSIQIAGEKAEETRKRIRHVALFKPDDTGVSDRVRTAWLLIGFETTVWSPLSAELNHGRNVPLGAWLSTADDLDAPRFAPQFWQSVSQDAPASRHALEDRARANLASHWKRRPTHVIPLKAEWRKRKTPEELLDMLLLQPGFAIGDGQQTQSILSAASRPRLFNQQLSIQVWHELFEEDPTPYAEPVGRFPLPEHLLLPPKPWTDVNALRWFDPLYDHFSISLRWFAPSGITLLSLDRIFVEFV